MTEVVDAPAVERARDAVARGAWDDAFRRMQAIGSARELSPEEFELLAAAAYGAGQLEAAIAAFEQAHAGHLAAGDHIAAAGAATSVAIHLMMDTGLMTPVRAWSRRAERLLEDQGETPVHAWLAMVQAYERLLSGDLERAGFWAGRAVDVGTRQGVAAAAAMGRLATARMRILGGEVEEGLDLLDEVAVVTVSGELEPLAVGMVYCELICAMQGLAQYDRAEEWTEAMERWRHDNAFGGMSGRCRVHRAEILRLRGSCAEAEEEALQACDELRPWMRREFGWPLSELGAIRLRRGDLVGAEEALLAAHENGWDPQPALSLLRLTQGDTAGAMALIRDALAHPLNVPSKERPPVGELRRAPLLDAQVEIAVAAGDLETARSAAAELTDVAERFRSKALTAGAALARGRVACLDGEHDAAISQCDLAVDTWTEVGAPYESAVARIVLGGALRAAGLEARATLEFGAARSTLERIGASHQAAVAAAACDGLLTPVTRTTSAAALSPGTVFRRDGDTRAIEYDGHAVRLQDLKGLRYLARLLAEPGREFHVLDLVALEHGEAPPVAAPGHAHDLPVAQGADAGPVLDEQAKRAYRRRLDEIDEDLEEAERIGDAERAALAEADRDFLVRELARAVGLGGRDRDLGSSAERARGSVTRAVRYAMTRIGEHHASLADHLTRTVRTGTYCSYAPDPRAPISWEV